MAELENWTTQSLKEYIEKILDEKDRALQAALAAAKEAVQAALVASEKAVNKAEINAEKWRENANEWRGAMMDRETKFVSRFEYDEWKKSVEASLVLEARRGALGEGERARLDGAMQRIEALDSLGKENREKITHVVAQKNAMAWLPLAAASVITGIVVAIVAAVLGYLARK